MGERADIEAWAASVARGDTTWDREGNSGAAESLSDDDVIRCLRLLTSAIKMADQPIDTNRQQWQPIDGDLRGLPERAKKVMPDIVKVRSIMVRSTTEIRAAAIGVAVERYRRAKGDWPTDLKQLVPDCMAALPTDPQTGESFQLARPYGGVSVYAPPGAGSPSKGEFHTIGSLEYEVIGFRLPEPAARR